MVNIKYAISFAFVGSAVIAVVIGELRSFHTYGRLVDVGDLSQFALVYGSFVGAVFISAFAALSISYLFCAFSLNIFRVRRFLLSLRGKLDQSAVVGEVFVAGTPVAALASKLDSEFVWTRGPTDPMPLSTCQAIRAELWSEFRRSLSQTIVASLIALSLFCILSSQLDSVGWQSVGQWPLLPMLLAVLMFAAIVWCSLELFFDSLLSAFRLAPIRLRRHPPGARQGIASEAESYAPIASALWQDLEPALTLFSDRIEATIESLRDQATKQPLAPVPSITATDLQTFKSAIFESAGGITHQLTSLKTEQSNLRATVKEQIRYDMERHDALNALTAKIGTMESTLARLARTSGGPISGAVVPLKSVGSEGKARASTNAVASDLEALLGQLGSDVAHDKSVD